MDVFCNAVHQTRGLGDGRQALCHPDSAPAQSLVLSIRGCALLDQAQRSPALFAPCTDGKQEDAGKRKPGPWSVQQRRGFLRGSSWIMKWLSFWKEHFLKGKWSWGRFHKRLASKNEDLCFPRVASALVTSGSPYDRPVLQDV